MQHIDIEVKYRCCILISYILHDLRGHHKRCESNCIFVYLCFMATVRHLNCVCVCFLYGRPCVLIFRCRLWNTEGGKHRQEPQLLLRDPAWSQTQTHRRALNCVFNKTWTKLQGLGNSKKEIYESLQTFVILDWWSNLKCIQIVWT